MNSNDLKIFEAVAENGSFTKAAEAIHTVQSNITARIKSLEEEFNARFFDRTSRSVELTEAGKTFIRYCKTIDRLTDEVRSELAASGRKVSGTLKIGCIETTMALDVPGVINQFSEKYPDVSLTFRADTSPNLVQDVLNYKLDAAFVAAPASDPVLATQVIKTEKLVVVSAVNQESLIKQPVRIVVFYQGCSYRPRLEMWLGTKGVVHYQCTVFNTLEGMTNFVEAGIGITVLPEDLVHKLYHNRKLKTHAIKGELGLLTTILVSRKDVPPSGSMKVFMDLF